MAWWTEKATALQSGVRFAENEAARANLYSEDEVQVAIVHTRQDLVLAVSLLTSLNAQLSTIKWLLGALALLALIGVAKI